jgi:LmbE family N-acetylglucosaminyl deacetylase
LINSEHDRHPDHGIAHNLVKRAAFLSGLRKLQTSDDGSVQEAWRPSVVYAYIQDYFREPDIILDVSEFWEQRMQCLMAYNSQFHDPNSSEPGTPISTPEFLKNIEGRSVQLARHIQCRHAEGLNVVRPAGVQLLSELY